jgi:hypothetical protein
MSAVLTSAEQNELHALLRQQGSLTQDDCWDAIEVFEKFLKEKRERINHDDILDRSIDGSFEYRDGFMDGVMFAENHHGIGEKDE